MPGTALSRPGGEPTRSRNDLAIWRKTSLSMRSVTSDQKAVSVTWASTSTMKYCSGSASRSFAAWARMSRVSEWTVIFGSSVTRGPADLALPLRWPLALRADLPLRDCAMALSLGRGPQARRGGPLAGDIRRNRAVWVARWRSPDGAAPPRNPGARISRRLTSDVAANSITHHAHHSRYRRSDPERG